MIKNRPPSYFLKILVPIFADREPGAALAAAQIVSGGEGLLLAGFVWVPEAESLSTAAIPAQNMRNKLRLLASQIGAQVCTKVRISHLLLDELIDLVRQESPDLLILEWPDQIDALNLDQANMLSQIPCNIAIVKGPLPAAPSRLLLPIRGGPYAELALRLSLSVYSQHHCELTALHLTPDNMLSHQDAPFKGLARVLMNIPEISRLEITTNNPAQAILSQSQGHDLVIMGVSAQPPEMQPALGGVVTHLFQHAPVGVIAVKSRRPIPVEMQSEAVGQTAISVLVDKWFAENTFFADEFQDLTNLLDLKQQQGLTISLALPALNEEATIGSVILTIKSHLMEQVPLLDEIVLLDSDSTDRTRQIAESLGVPVYIHQQVLPQYGCRTGKGEALWKSLYVTSGDILLWVDTDIVNIHPRFVYGLLGALISNPQVQFVKGFYRRPIRVGDKIQAGGGGRVTELTARPLLNMFYPELSGVVQPLSGEYGGRRTALEQLPFFSGYGVEIGLLVDVFERFGLDAIAQVDLLERIHHNQSLEALSKMSFAIIQAIFNKLEKRHHQDLLEEVNKTMKLIRYKPGRFFLDVEEIAEAERPPMNTILEYRQKWAL